MQLFVQPIHLGILQIIHPATQYEIPRAKTLHDEGVQTFQSYQIIQRALVQQVLETVEDKNLSSYATGSQAKYH